MKRGEGGQRDERVVGKGKEREVGEEGSLSPTINHQPGSLAGPLVLANLALSPRPAVKGRLSSPLPFSPSSLSLSL